jgi:hypothetical protein
MKLKIAKVIRILTLAQLIAVATLCVLFAYDRSFFSNEPALLVVGIIFLGVLPLLAYPLQPVIPGFRGKGREGQRSLAMIFAVLGYVLGCITNVFMHGTPQLWIIYLEYLLSGVAILVFNKVFKLRASAHACGIAGPAVMLASFGVLPALAVGAVAYAAALWASLVMKRHTLPQFIGGALIPIILLVPLHIIF